MEEGMRKPSDGKKWIVITVAKVLIGMKVTTWYAIHVGEYLMPNNISIQKGRFDPSDIAKIDVRLRRFLNNWQVTEYYNPNSPCGRRMMVRPMIR